MPWIFFRLPDTIGPQHVQRATATCSSTHMGSLHALRAYNCKRFLHHVSHTRHFTYWLSSSPNPSLPSSPQPHENTTPSLVTTATWALPQLTDVTSKLNSASINFGFDELDQSPCPRQPCSPRPQVITMPLSVTNTVNLPPQHTLWTKTKHVHKLESKCLLTGRLFPFG